MSSFSLGDIIYDSRYGVSCSGTYIQEPAITSVLKGKSVTYKRRTRNAPLVPNGFQYLTKVLLNKMNP